MMDNDNNSLLSSTNDHHEMTVTKRGGSRENVSFDKILTRMKVLGAYNNDSLNINYTQLAMKIIEQLYDGIQTSDIDELTAQQCASMTTIHPDYAILASRILVSNHHKNTERSFSKVMKELYEFRDIHNVHYPKISKDIYDIVCEYGDMIDAWLDFSRDYDFDYFGFKTLERAYLMKNHNKIIERPQHMWMRVSLGIHGKNLDKAKTTYDLMSKKYFTHATPTLFNAGTPRPQLSSCYLIGMESDSIKGIYNTLTECALISKYAGGIGLHIHNIRTKDAHIRGTNGKGDGIVPMLRVFNSTARYVNQCFAPETFVYSENGIVEMKDVIEGDRLVTIDGSYRRVLQVMVKYVEKDILMLETMMTHRPVRVTKEHQVYCIQTGNRSSVPEIVDDLKKGVLKPEYHNADILRVGDYVCYPYHDTRYDDVSKKIIPTFGVETFLYDNKIWVKIVSLRTMFYQGHVYDFNMEDNHNYLTDMGIVHNSGKRNGSFAMYLEPWHGDIEDFLELKKNHGDEELKARDLFYALWIPDLFMKRVKENGVWSLMCPDECRGLQDVYGDEFEALYTKYESEGKFQKQLPARKLWFSILDSQIETGTPYILFKDSANKKSNQKNLGTIKSSNLCSEIIEYSDENQTAVCNLASVGLPMFVEPPNTKWIERVKIISRTKCEYCKLAKALLKRNNIEFTETVLDDDTERREFYNRINENEKITDETKMVNSVPQIYINHERIGGYTELEEVLRPQFNYGKLIDVIRVMTYNLNRVIDINFYPTDKTERSNIWHRPIGIGVQGLADVFALMNLPFDSEKAKQVNRGIFETIYYASLLESNSISRMRQEGMRQLKQTYKKLWMFETNNFTHQTDLDYSRTYKVFDDLENTETMETIQRLLHTLKPIRREMELLSENHLGAYSSFEGSPTSQGILQFDMWGDGVKFEMGYDWNALKQSIQEWGIRNSLLVAPMPTASTSQILGNNECFEPFTSNIYSRRTMAGEFIIINKYLLRELIDLGLWNEHLKNIIVASKGSIQHIEGMPKVLRDKYKIVWEMPMRSLIEMSRDRGAFVCQSQSLNLWMENPTYDKLTAMHFFSWSQGLKTGIYYLRTKAKASAQQFTIDPELAKQVAKKKNEDDEEGCLMCSG